VAGLARDACTMSMAGAEHTAQVASRVLRRTFASPGMRAHEQLS
jgi:hypothetical protein